MAKPPALELLDIMRGVIDEGIGATIRGRYGITADVSGKTGTSQENTDGWFIMTHPQLVASARVGFNDTLTISSWGQGTRTALPMCQTSSSRRCGKRGSNSKRSSMFRGRKSSQCRRRNGPYDVSVVV